jgi:hypothetical protein
LFLFLFLLNNIYDQAKYMYTNHHDERPPPNEKKETRDRPTQANTGQWAQDGQSKQMKANEGPQQPAQANEGQQGLREDDNNENGPERRVWRRSGPRYMFFRSFFFISLAFS